jgi:hypothetical protein
VILCTKNLLPLIAFSGVLSNITFAAETENNIENLSHEKITAVAEKL